MGTKRQSKKPSGDVLQRLEQIQNDINDRLAARTQQRQAKKQQAKDAATQARLDARAEAHPIGTTYNGWTIVGYRGLHARATLVIARHRCGHEIRTSVARIAAQFPIRCVACSTAWTLDRG